MALRCSLTDLRLFVAAYESRSFTAAAARENATQSGVSHHIRQLELAFDIKLFVRGKLGIMPTPAADDFYRYCLEVLQKIHESSIRMGSFAPGFQGAFTVGIIPVLTHRIAATALLEFKQRHPNTRVRIIESFGSQLPMMVTTGVVDFAITTPQGGEAGLRFRRLWEANECLIGRATPAASANDADAYPRSVKLAWATGLEARRRAILSSFAANDIAVETTMDVDSALTMLDLVSRSDWSMVGPSLLVDPAIDADRFSVKPLCNPNVNFEIVTLEKLTEALSPEAEDFTRIFTEKLAAADHAWVS